MSEVLQTQEAAIEVARTFDLAQIYEILHNPEIFDAISEDGVLPGDIKLDVMNDYWVAFWAGETVIGVFQIKQMFAQTWDAHIHVLPQYRKQYTAECGAAMWHWIEDNLKQGLIYTNVPVNAMNVRKFLEDFGFELSGLLKNAWRKNGSQRDMFILTREI